MQEAIPMAYMSQTLKAKLAPKVKEVLTKYKLKGRLSVRNHSTLVLNIASGEIDFLGNYFENKGGDYPANEPKGYIDVNVYHYGRSFDGPAYDFLNEVHAAMMDGNWDNSEPQYDHFDRGWHVSICIGRWNKKYELINQI
jgi:hypothetical protein